MEESDKQSFHFSMKEPLPDNVKKLLEENEDQVVVSVSSDMTTDGFYGESWLIATEKEIFVIEPDNSNPIVQHFSVNQLRSILVRNLYGNGVIEVSLKNKVIDLFRFSRSYADKMSEVGDALTRLSNKVEFEVIEESGEESNINRCIKCGKSIPTDIRICPDCIERKQTLGRLFEYVSPYKKLVFSIIVLAVMGTVFSLIPQLLTKTLVDEVILQERADLLIWIVVAMLVTFGLRALFDGIRIVFTARLGQNVLFDLRTNLYEHLQKLSVNFFDKRQTGSIMARVIGDVNQLQGFLSEGLQQITIQFFTVIIICIFLFATNMRLAAISLLPLPFIFFATRIFNRALRKVWHRIRRRAAELNAILGDTLPGIRVVKAFSQEGNEIEKFTNKHTEFYNVFLVAASMRASFYPAMGFIIAFGIMVFWYIGGNEVIVGMQNPELQTITLGDLMLFTTLLWRIQGPVRQMSQLTGRLQQAATSAERIFEIMDNQPEKPDSDEPISMENIKGEIVFENVNFEYEKGEKVLDNINLTIKPGEMIGLVGASGSGKTTLINLLSRFYRIKEGRILVDGVDINDVEIRSLRDQMSLVLQEPFLFHATIAENIAYSKPDASREEIIWAARMANAHDFISKFPDGYDTVLGERGTGLSGGQKQRVSIARAIMRDPSILILDEATSAVDTVTESLIQEAIDKLVRNRTTIAIAHRLSTLKNADRIIVMEEGAIVEQGTHEELLEEDGMFARLVNMQSEIARNNIDEMSDKFKGVS